MPRLDTASAIAILELQRLVSDYCFELDETFGLQSHRFYTEDAVIDIGKMAFRGHEEIRAFYRKLAEIIREQHPDGMRTTRHAYTNLRVSLEGDEAATVDFLVTEFSSAGSPPLFGASVPTVVSDARFRCRRNAEGDWRIFEFTGRPLFVGDDPVLTKVLVG